MIIKIICWAIVGISLSAFSVLIVATIMSHKEQEKKRKRPLIDKEKLCN